MSLFVQRERGRERKRERDRERETEREKLSIFEKMGQFQFSASSLAKEGERREEGGGRRV